MRVTVKYYTGEVDVMYCESLIYENRCLIFIGREDERECIELKHVVKIDMRGDGEK